VIPRHPYGDDIGYGDGIGAAFTLPVRDIFNCLLPALSSVGLILWSGSGTLHVPCEMPAPCSPLPWRSKYPRPSPPTWRSPRAELRIVSGCISSAKGRSSSEQGTLSLPGDMPMTIYSFSAFRVFFGYTKTRFIYWDNCRETIDTLSEIMVGTIDQRSIRHGRRRLRTKTWCRQRHREAHGTVGPGRGRAFLARQRRACPDLQRTAACAVRHERPACVRR
jgi:hypothetical protein